METGNVSVKTVEPMQAKSGEQAKTYEKSVSLEMEPDVVEISGKEAEEAPKASDVVMKKIVAGTSGVAICAPQIGKISKKASEFVVNGIKQVAEDFGKSIENIPKALPASVKYATLILGGLSAFLIATKDSDNDGKLDILEGVGKLIKPAD